MFEVDGNLVENGVPHIWGVAGNLPAMVQNARLPSMPWAKTSWKFVKLNYQPHRKTKGRMERNKPLPVQRILLYLETSRERAIPVQSWKASLKIRVRDSGAPTRSAKGPGPWIATPGVQCSFLQRWGFNQPLAISVNQPLVRVRTALGS